MLLAATPPLRILLTASALALMGAIAAGCASGRHGWTTAEFEGQLLRAQRGPGADRLEIESDYDQALRTYVGDKGPPDYIFVESYQSVALFYLERDEVAWFKREGWNPSSKIAVQKPIPDGALKFFSADERSRILARRVAEKAERLDPKVAEVDATISNAVRKCLAITENPDHAASCDVDYLDGVLTMLVQFETRQAAEGTWETVAGSAIRTFCDASNNANRLAIVYLSVGSDEFKPYSCELGRWGDWQATRQRESAT